MEFLVYFPTEEGPLYFGSWRWEQRCAPRAPPRHFSPSIDCWLPLTPHHNPLVLQTDKPSCNSKKASSKENIENAGKVQLLGPAPAPMSQLTLLALPPPHLCEGQPSQQICFNPDSKAWRQRGVWLYFYFRSQRNLGWGIRTQSWLKWFADNTNMHYIPFQTQAFQMSVVQQHWASEGHAGNPGAS